MIEQTKDIMKRYGLNFYEKSTPTDKILQEDKMKQKNECVKKFL